MTTYTEVFSSETVPPAGFAYQALSISQNTTVTWPYNTSGGTALSKLIDLTATVGSLVLTLPDATQVSTGEDFLIRNVGGNSVAIHDSADVPVATVAAGAATYFYVTSNATSAGTYGVVAYGVGTSSVDAASLVGYGIIASGSTLNQAHSVTSSASGVTIDATYRAKVFNFTGGSATLALTAAATLADNFFTLVRNSGSGTLTIDPAGAETIDGAATLGIQPGESLLLFCSGSAWYSVGYGRSIIYNFTQLVKDLSAYSGGSVTLTSSEAANKLLTFTGNPASTVTVVVPNVVAVYYLLNSLSTATSVTVKTAAGTGVAVPQTQRIIAISDSTNVYSAQSVAASSTVSIVDGSVSSPSLAFASQTNTGLYKYSTYGIGLTANGTSILFLDPTAGLGFNTNKFTVAYATGNTAVAGTLNVTGHTIFEGVTSTGATGTGKLVYDTSATLSATLAMSGAISNPSNYAANFGSGTLTAGAGSLSDLIVTGATPRIRLTGTEGSAKNVTFYENAGHAYIGEYGVAAWADLSSTGLSLGTNSLTAGVGTFSGVVKSTAAYAYATPQIQITSTAYGMLVDGSGNVSFKNSNNGAYYFVNSGNTNNTLGITDTGVSIAVGVSTIGTFSSTGLSLGTNSLTAGAVTMTGGLSPQYLDTTGVTGAILTATHNKQYVNNALIGDFSSTGLAVTTSAATGTIITNSTAASGSIGIDLQRSGTTKAYFAEGTYAFVGGGAGVRTAAGVDFSVAIGGATEQLIVSSAGAAVTGALSATGVITSPKSLYITSPVPAGGVIPDAAYPNTSPLTFTGGESKFGNWRQYHNAAEWGWGIIYNSTLDPYTTYPPTFAVRDAYNTNASIVAAQRFDVAEGASGQNFYAVEFAASSTTATAPDWGTAAQYFMYDSGLMRIRSNLTEAAFELRTNNAATRKTWLTRVTGAGHYLIQDTTANSNVIPAVGDGVTWMDITPTTGAVAFAGAVSTSASTNGGLSIKASNTSNGSGAVAQLIASNDVSHTLTLGMTSSNYTSYNDTAYIQTNGAGGIKFFSDVAFTGKAILATSTPASAAATGTTGTVTWDASYIYICTATNTWKRVAIATW